MKSKKFVKNDEYYRYVMRCEYCGEMTTYTVDKGFPKDLSGFRRFIDSYKKGEYFSVCPACDNMTKQTLVAYQYEDKAEKAKEGL